ncbi:hypothetical protein HGA88_00040 [Candidatus Roizmanbacteria bacterium]|nr:hypothetical protein [Candidatus Roizmanbacteria bacterium]
MKFIKDLLLLSKRAFYCSYKNLDLYVFQSVLFVLQFFIFTTTVQFEKSPIIIPITLIQIVIVILSTGFMYSIPYFITLRQKNELVSFPFVIQVSFRNFIRSLFLIFLYLLFFVVLGLVSLVFAYLFSMHWESVFTLFSQDALIMLIVFFPISTFFPIYFSVEKKSVSQSVKQSIITVAKEWRLSLVVLVMYTLILFAPQLVQGMNIPGMKEEYIQFVYGVIRDYFYFVIQIAILLYYQKFIRSSKVQLTK